MYIMFNEKSFNPMILRECNKLHMQTYLHVCLHVRMQSRTSQGTVWVLPWIFFYIFKINCHINLQVAEWFYITLSSSIITIFNTYITTTLLYIICLNINWVCLITCYDHYYGIIGQRNLTLVSSLTSTV